MTDLPAVEPGEWLVGLSSVVIQDGNYDDFEVGQRRRFALEFYEADLAVAPDAEPSASAVGDGRYDVTARVGFADRGLAVLDFGLLAYRDTIPPAVEPGATVRCRVFLEVDKFSYFERHAKREGVPPAVYSWTITGIWRRPAAFPAAIFRGTGVQSVRPGHERLERTQAWLDDASDGYVLRCRLEADAPSRSL